VTTTHDLSNFENSNAIVILLVSSFGSVFCDTDKESNIISAQNAYCRLLCTITNAQSLPDIHIKASMFTVLERSSVLQISLSSLLCQETGPGFRETR
jgi:hypothetical protein